MRHHCRDDRDLSAPKMQRKNTKSIGIHVVKLNAVCDPKAREERRSKGNLETLNATSPFAVAPLVITNERASLCSLTLIEDIFIAWAVLKLANVRDL